ncbi:MAG: hypothetical protein M3R00_05575 [Pseudomonadota bacterium]|nr:hypothetical protein [Pseudomonadota bacterium]
MKHQIAATKIIDPSINALNNKVITIHAFKNLRNAIAWENVINETTREFDNQRVYPTILPKDDYPITGSLYFTHRSDDDGHGKYTAENIMPLESSPYKVFVISIPRQYELLEMAQRIESDVKNANEQTGDTKGGFDTSDESSSEYKKEIGLEFDKHGVKIEDDNDQGSGCRNC